MIEPGHRRQAISWWVCLQSGAVSEQERADLEDWLRADPRHRQAWERVHEVERGVRQVPAPLAHAAFKVSSPRRAALRGLMGLGAAALTGWGVYRHAPWQHLLADYRTDIGQTREVALGPGANVVLAGDTALRVHQDGGRYQLQLLRGEVLATVHTARLQLDTGYGQLHAQQARFCAARTERGCRVELLDGELALERDARLTRVQAPQGLRLGSSGHLRETPVDKDAASWVDGLLIAQDWSLDRLAVRLARQRHGVIQVDERVAGMRLSGVFPLYDAERALAAASRSLPIAVQRRNRFWLSVVPA